MSEHDPKSAQNQLEKAIVLAHAVGYKSSVNDALRNDPYPNGDGRNVSGDIQMTGGGGLDTISHYTIADGGYEEMRSTATLVNGVPGKYESDIESVQNPDEGNYTEASASVTRGDTTHTFKNPERAATLITSIAARRLGGRATRRADEQIDRLSAARDAYHSE